jgi:hypothetical protein
MVSELTVPGSQVELPGVLPHAVATPATPARLAAFTNFLRSIVVLWCFLTPLITGLIVLNAIVSGSILIATWQQMKSTNSAEIAERLAKLREEHRDLDEAIKRLSDETWRDQLQLRRMKKRKLKLRDWIAHLESLLIPDLDA